MKNNFICKKMPFLVAAIFLAMCVCTGCGGESASTDAVGSAGASPDGSASAKDAMQSSSDEASGAEADTGDRDNTPVVLVPEASGQTVYESGDVSVDASNSSEGYVMVKYSGSAEKVRMLVDTPEGNQYNYLLPLDGEYAAYPLSEGSGTYQIGVYENISDDKYAQIYSQSVGAQIADENKTFLYPNEYVDFNADTKAVAKGAELAKGAADDLAVVEAVYDFVITHVSYDYDKAANVKSGYLPVVDDTLASGTGICFDYASLMATMLRSQRIPTKLEIGYVDDMYHAWVSIYLSEQGWIENMIYFDGSKWSLADPTLASYAQDDVVKDHMDNADSLYDIKYKY